MNKHSCSRIPILVSVRRKSGSRNPSDIKLTKTKLFALSPLKSPPRLLYCVLGSSELGQHDRRHNRGNLHPHW